MWNDIDLYHAYRDFTTDPNSFPLDEVRKFIAGLVSFPNPADKKTRAHVSSRQVIIRDVRSPGRTAKHLDRLQQLYLSWMLRFPF